MMIYHSEPIYIEHLRFILRSWNLDESCVCNLEKFLLYEHDRVLCAGPGNTSMLYRRKFIEHDYADRLDELASGAESSIEVLMGAYLLLMSDGYNFLYYERMLEQVPNIGSHVGTLFTNQVRRLKYRADFLFYTYCGRSVQEVIVECDGHIYHENKFAAARDRKRDRRLLTLQNISTLRFTGSEIHINPLSCARQVSFALQRMITGALEEKLRGSR